MDVVMTPFSSDVSTSPSHCYDDSTYGSDSVVIHNSSVLVTPLDYSNNTYVNENEGIHNSNSVNTNNDDVAYDDDEGNLSNINARCNDNGTRDDITANENAVHNSEYNATNGVRSINGRTYVERKTSSLFESTRECSAVEGIKDEAVTDRSIGCVHCGTVGRLACTTSDDEVVVVDGHGSSFVYVLDANEGTVVENERHSGSCLSTPRLPSTAVSKADGTASDSVETSATTAKDDSGFIRIARSAASTVWRVAMAGVSGTLLASLRHIPPSNNTNVNDEAAVAVAQIAARAAAAAATESCDNSDIRGDHVVITDVYRKRINEDGHKYINQYLVLHTIGRGSHGKVKLIRDESGQQYALKVVKRAQSRFGQRNFVDVYREIAIQKELDHQRTVKLREVIDDPSHNKVYMVMDYLPGGPIDYVDQSGKPLLTISQAKHYFRDLLSGIEYLHDAGIVHGDIKPENMLLDAHGCAVLCDYSASRTVDMRSVVTLGSPAFTPPELCCEYDQASEVDWKAADLWAAGVSLYCFVKGKPPFEAASIDELYQSILTDEPSPASSTMAKDEQLLDMLSGLLEKDPSERLTLKSAQNHPWLMRNASTSVFSSPQLQPGVINSDDQLTCTDSDERDDDDGIIYVPVEPLSESVGKAHEEDNVEFYTDSRKSCTESAVVSKEIMESLNEPNMGAVRPQHSTNTDGGSLVQFSSVFVKFLEMREGVHTFFSRGNSVKMKVNADTHREETTMSDINII